MNILECGVSTPLSFSERAHPKESGVSTPHSKKTEEAMSTVRCAAWVGVVLLALVRPLPARAELHFPQAQMQAGEVRSGTSLARRFAFDNPGPDAVTITELKASCGC